MAMSNPLVLSSKKSNGKFTPGMVVKSEKKIFNAGHAYLCFIILTENKGIIFSQYPKKGNFLIPIMILRCAEE